MKFKTIVGAATALAFAGALLAAPAAYAEESVETPVETSTVVKEVAEEVIPEATPEALPVPEAVVETIPTPVEETPAFVPYTASVRWILPASWDFKKTPTYQEAIYPQVRGMVIPCNRWSQDDVYLIDTPEDEALYLSLGDTLSYGEDGSIYQSHVYTKGEACGPTAITVPVFEPLPPTCDTAGSLPFLGNPAAQNPNGYEFPGQGFRVYVSPAFTGAGTYTLTIQKVGPGFDAAFPYGTKVTGQTSQTLTVLPATGVTQSTDAEAPCYVAPPVIEEPPVTNEPPTTDQPPVVVDDTPVTVALVTDKEPAEPLATELAYTGGGSSSPALWAIAGLSLALGAVLAAIGAVRRRQGA